jgi:hypothetical protein
MRATLEVGQLPIEEPSDDLEDRILAAALDAERGEPWHRKALRMVSWAGSHVARPQFAMAALLMLVLGSSVLLLRARPGSVAVTPAASPDPARVQEPRAQPLAQAEGEAKSNAAEAPAPAAAASGPRQAAGDDADQVAEAAPNVDYDKAFDRAMGNYRSGKHQDAQRDFATVGNSGDKRASSASLYEARSVRAHSGCGAAIPYYQRVRERFGGTTMSGDAAWEQADCHKQLGQDQQARDLWLALQSNDDYRDQASGQLASQGQVAAKAKASPDKFEYGY